VRRADVARIVSKLDVAGAVEPILGLAVGEVTSPASGMPIEAQFEAQLVLEQSFDPQSIEERVIEVFVARYQREHVLAAQAWLESPGGQRLAALDRAEPRIAALAVAGPVEDLVARDEFAVRHLLFEHIDEVTGGSQAVSRRMRSVVRAMLEGANAARPPERRIDAETITDVVDQEVRRIEDSAPAGGMLSLHHRFRVVPTSELRAYADFVECDAGRWLHETLNDALDRALRGAAQEAGAALARTLAKGS
jgi:hypothetical protein